MSNLIFILTFAGSVVLAWLVLTNQLRFPILFETGLSMVAGGLAIAAFLLIEDQFSIKPVCVVGFGVLLMGLSVVRQSRKQRREFRHGLPRELDGRQLHNVPGGKK